MKQLNTWSDADEIKAYLYADTNERRVPTLSTSLARKLRRMETAAELLRKYGSRQRVVGMLLKLSTYTEMGSDSRATAYRDVDDAIDVFGTEHRKSKAFYVDMLFEMMYSTREKALAAQDLKTVVACEKNIKDAVKDFLGDKEAVDWSKLQPPRFMVGFFPELLNVPLPDNLDQELEKFFASKRKKGLTVTDAEDVQILPE